MAAVASKTMTAVQANTAPPLPSAPVQTVQVGKTTSSTVPTPAAQKAAAPLVAPKAEAVSIVTGKPVTTDNGTTAAKIEAKASAATPAAVAAKPWYADQSKLMKIALVSIVLYFLYKKFFN